MNLNESIVEDATLTWFGELGYAVGHGPHIAPGELTAERDSCGEIISVNSKNNWPRQSPGPVANRESPVLDVNFTGAGAMKQLSNMATLKNFIHSVN